MKTLSTTNASTSYHLLSDIIKSVFLGKACIVVPSLCITAVTPNTFLSGKNIFKNGLTSLLVITFLKILVTPFTTTSLLVIV